MMINTVDLLKSMDGGGAMSASKTLALPCVFFLCLGASLSGCALLPSLENRTTSVAYPDTADTRLGGRLLGEWLPIPVIPASIRFDTPAMPLLRYLDLTSRNSDFCL